MNAGAFTGLGLDSTLEGASSHLVPALGESIGGQICRNLSCYIDSVKSLQQTGENLVWALVGPNV